MPYARTEITDEENDWFLTLADVLARDSATALARDQMRLGYAHRYLIIAHLHALLEGAGEAETGRFLERAMMDLTASNRPKRSAKWPPLTSKVETDVGAV
jgi:hypothetical protein